MLEALHGARRGRRPERRAEALVGALMEVEAIEELAVERLARLDDGAAIVSERGVDRQSPRRRLDDEAIEPFGRNEIEQRRRDDEVERTLERELEIAHEIDRPHDDSHRRPLSRLRGLRQQAEVVVDEPPG